MIKKILFLICVLLFSTQNIKAQDNDFYTYLRQLKYNVSKEWHTPNLSGLYTADINFQIKKDGTIEGVKVVKTSGNKKIDDKALETISSIGKQAPLPSVYPSDSIDVTMQLSSNHVSTAYIKQQKRHAKKSYKKVERIVEHRPVKIKKVIYDAIFDGVSNFQDNMIQPVFNLNIQNALKSGY